MGGKVSTGRALKPEERPAAEARALIGNLQAKETDPTRFKLSGRERRLKP
jgi:hypothetical protein